MRRVDIALHFLTIIVGQLLSLSVVHAEQLSDASKTAIQSCAVKVAELFSWEGKAESLECMTERGLADYCLAQSLIAKRPENYSIDPAKVPNTSNLKRLQSKYALNIDKILRATGQREASEILANLESYFTEFQEESGDLVKRLDLSQLVGLAQEVQAETTKLTPKPTTFETGEITIDGDAVEVAVYLKGYSLPKSKETTQPPVMRFQFEFSDDKWLFDGLDTTGMLADQQSVASQISLAKIYIPGEYANANLFDNTNRWSFQRSRQSEHFIVLWGKGYGHATPGSQEVSKRYRVDIDDLLISAERFYDTNVNRLKFADLTEERSNLNKHKMLIFLLHTDDWVAAGAGSDDVIGALWISPNACQPVGSTVAHEIGHCFQYQVHCDLKGQHGFRYGFGDGGSGGNGFWEQSAQWQALQDFPEQVFRSHDFPVYIKNCHRHFHHEWQRYASYFLPFYWKDKHGEAIMGRVWRESLRPEDPIQAYMRITGLSIEQFNDEFYDAASRFATWDIDSLREIGTPYIGKHKFQGDETDTGAIRVSYDCCPGTTGYNVINLDIPKEGSIVQVEFKGLVNQAGYNQVANPDIADWRYGFVALDNQGQRVYGQMHRGKENTVSFEVPPASVGLWFVVTGAPNEYHSHAWDENEKNDEQWPYEVRFTGTMEKQ